MTRLYFHRNYAEYINLGRRKKKEGFGSSAGYSTYKGLASTSKETWIEKVRYVLETFKDCEGHCWTCDYVLL